MNSSTAEKSLLLLLQLLITVLFILKNKCKKLRSLRHGVISQISRVKRASVYHIAKIHGNQSNCC